MNREEMILNNMPLINYIINQLGLQSMREDLFSIGLIGLIKGVDNYDSNKSSSSTYLYWTIKHEILQTFRKKRVNTVSIETPVEGNLTLEDALADDYDFTKDVENNDLLNEVYANLDKLKPRDKEILIEYYGLFNTKTHTQQELSNKFDIPQSYISRIIRKSVKELKELVGV